MAFEIDMTGDTPETIDRPQYAAPGWYRANLIEVEPDGDSGAEKLTFEINRGDYLRCRTAIRLFDPSLAETQDKAKKAMERIKAVAKRLGLIDPQADAGKMKPVDFVDAIGREAVVQVVERQYPKNDGTFGTAKEIAYLGVYSLDHPEIPNHVRKELELAHYDPAKDQPAAGRGSKAKNGSGSAASRTPVGAGAGTGGGASGKGVDVSDL